MEQNKDFPNFWTAALILSLLVGIQIIIGMIFYDLGYRFHTGDPGASAIIIVLSNGVAFSILMAYKKISYRDIFNPIPRPVISVLIILAVPVMLTLGGAVFWISDITNFLMLYFPISDSDYQMFTRLMGGGLVSIMTVCAIGPIIEEMLFRGIILRGFLENYSVQKSIVLSAVLFALFHLNLYQIPVAFFVGCLFGWLYVRTGSLWPSIFGHIFYNSFCTAVDWVDHAPVLDGREMKVEFYPLAVNVIAVVATVTGLLCLAYILRPSVKTDS